MNDMHMIRPSARYLIARMAITFFAVESIYALIIIASLSYNLNTSFTTAALIGLLLIHTIKFIILIFLLADLVIRFLSVRYYVTNNHLVVGSGIVNNQEKTYELSQVKKVEVYQDWLGKKFDYGTIISLFTAPGFDETLRLVNVASPHKGAEILEKHLSDYQATTQQPAK